MRINNLTPFLTADLKRLAQAVAERELEPHQRRDVTVHFVPRRSRMYKAARARILGFRARTVGALPQGLKFNQAIVTLRIKGGCRKKQVALLLAHEFAEMRGLTHAQMKTPRYFFQPGWERFYAWAEELPVRLKTQEKVVIL